jgi:hypothetical protein
MEARAVPGLFFIGEVVDVTGQLGGFNFQWAWASGVAAGRGRGEDKTLADQGEAHLREFGLEKLIFRAGEEVGFSAGDGGDEVVDDDGFAVERALLVGVGGQLDGNDGAFLFGDDGPEVAIVAGHGKNQEGFQSAGVEVGEEDSGGVRGQTGGGGVAIGGDVEEKTGAWPDFAHERR